MSCIHFKFKSSLEYEKITFDGLHISLGDLKEAIMKQKKIGVSNQYTLRVVDAQSKKVYEGDSEMLPRNTSVIISRVPLVNAPKIPKTQHKDPTLLPQPDSSSLVPMSSSSTDNKKLTAEELRKTADIANANATEEEKLKAVISQSGEGFDPSQYARVAPGRSSGGSVPMGLMKPPPPSYVCFRCGQRGHWIKLCPTNGDPNYDNYRYKRSMGIPASQIVPASETNPLAMKDRHGNLVVRQVDLNAFLQSKQAKAVDPKEKKELEIPSELICHICKKLVKDAVIIPCCGESFCYDCIQDYLCENEFTCPICKKTNVSPDNLAPNKALRTSAKNFTMKASEEKSVAMARGFVPVVPQVTPQKAVLASKGLNSIGPDTVTPTTVSANASNSQSISSTPTPPSNSTTSTVSNDTAVQLSSGKNGAAPLSVAEGGSKSMDNSAAPGEEASVPMDSEKDGLQSENASVSGPLSDQKTSKEEADGSSKETGSHLSLPGVDRKRSRSKSPSPSTRPPKKRSTSPMPSGGTTDTKTSGSERAREYLERMAQAKKCSSAQTITAPILLSAKSSLLPQPLRPPLPNAASLLGLPHPMSAIPGLPSLPVIQSNLVNSLPIANTTLPPSMAKASSKIPASTEQNSSDISKLERIAADLLLSSATAVSKKSTSPPPLTAEEFYRQQKLLKQITKKQKRQQSESSGSYSRSSVSYSRSATPDSTFSSDNSRSRSLTPSQSVSRSSSYSSSSRSRSRSRSPHYSSLKSHHNHRSRQHRSHRRHRHEKEKEKREKTSAKHRHRHKPKRQESSIQPKTKAVKRSRKHRSRSRSPQLRKKHRVGDSLLSPEVSTAATTPEMVDPEAQLMMKPSHRHKHKKEKRKHRHRRREVAEMEGSLDDHVDQPAVADDVVKGVDDGVMESESIASGQPESEAVTAAESGEVDQDKTETMETVTGETTSITPDGEHQEDQLELLPDETTDLADDTVDETAAKVDLVPYQDSSNTEAEHPSDATVSTADDHTKEEPQPVSETKDDHDDTLLGDEGDDSMMISVYVDDAIDECSAELLDSECTQPEDNIPGKEEGEISDSEDNESTELEEDLLKVKEKTPPEARLSESLKARLGDLPTDNTPVELKEDELDEEIIKKKLELMTKDLNNVLKNIPKLVNNNKTLPKEKVANKKHTSKPKSIAVSALHPLVQHGSDLEDTTSELSPEEDTSSDSNSEDDDEPKVFVVPVKSSKSKSAKHSGSSKKHKRRHSLSSSSKQKEKEHKHERKRKRSKDQKSMKAYKPAKKSKSSRDREREKLREKEREKEKMKKRKKHKKH